MCPRVVTGGISRFKKHIAHIKGDVARCPNSDDEAKKLCREFIENTMRKKEEAAKAIEEERLEVSIYGEKEDQEILEIGPKRPRSKGPIDKFTDSTLDPEVAASLREGEKIAQKSIMDSFAKEQRDKVNDYLAHWVYKCGISFNAVTEVVSQVC